MIVILDGRLETMDVLTERPETEMPWSPPAKSLIFGLAEQRFYNVQCGSKTIDTVRSPRSEDSVHT